MNLYRPNRMIKCRKGAKTRRFDVFYIIQLIRGCISNAKIGEKKRFKYERSYLNNLRFTDDIIIIATSAKELKIRKVDLMELVKK